MTMRRSDFGQRQSGAALLLTLLVVIVAIATALSGGLARNALAVQQQNNTRLALAEARRALLHYQVLRGERGDGRDFALPCPDIDDSGGFPDGVAHDSACGAVGETVLGRLPWKTLGIPPLSDASSACLWYVVSGSWKDAAAQTAELINADSNGQLQLFDIESGSLIGGGQPQDRPVALVLAAMRPVAGQTRPASVSGRQCAPAAVAAAYLDADAGTGISNAALSGVADGIDAVATGSGFNTTHNDRVATISRFELAAATARRTDLDTAIGELGLAIAACFANYAATNPGGPGDLRLPWPATTALPDYRLNSAYDDASAGFLSGRLADRVDDSNADTGNTLVRVLQDCDSAAVPAWSPVVANRWAQWKDHFFYAVAPAFAPDAATPNSCGSCLTVNGSGQYAAVIIFGGPRLPGQVRNAPPIDADTKSVPGNYLEASNGTSIPGSTTDYFSAAASPSFNDRLFCIDPSLSVSEC